MTAITERIKSELIQLSVRERSAIAHFLIDSLGKEDNQAEEDWDAEVVRRWEAVKNGTAIGEPAEKVFGELREKYS